MRTLVDIPDSQIELLDGIARKAQRSRASLIRDAVADLIAKHRPTSSNDAFGLWSKATGEKIDGLEYQERLRREW